MWRTAQPQSCLCYKRDFGFVKPSLQEHNLFLIDKPYKKVSVSLLMAKSNGRCDKILEIENITAQDPNFN